MEEERKEGRGKMKYKKRFLSRNRNRVPTLLPLTHPSREQRLLTEEGLP
jgi:hypothetical protein